LCVCVCVCVLKVSESCGFVFLDGSELRGSSAASIIVKYGRHARFIQFRVWIPELPLDVEVSDARLGRFIGWQVPVPASNATELTTRWVTNPLSHSLPQHIYLNLSLILTLIIFSYFSF